MKMYCYTKCSTCKKAEKFLQAKNINVEFIDYTKQPLTIKQLQEYIKKSGLDINRFFNTSGLLYREFDIKNKKDSLSEQEKLHLLSANPMLVKRPILVTPDTVLVGFNEKKWDELFN